LQDRQGGECVSRRQQQDHTSVILGR